jgi:hypothetical protein
MRFLTLIIVLIAAAFIAAQAPDSASPKTGPAVEQPQPAAPPENAAPSATQPAAQPEAQPAAQPAVSGENKEEEKPVKKAENGEAAPAAGQGEKTQWSVGLGYVTVDGKQWTRLSLRPDIPLGKFGICLDIELFIDDQGNISKKGWDFDNAANAFESIQRKIYYLRYGHPGDKFYAKVGALDDVTLGYGLIMYGHSNALQYPDIRKLGLHTELNDMGSLGIGFQGMINNFSDFNREGALLGARVSVKPIKSLGIPILSGLDVGVSYVSDLNQRAVLRDRDGDKVPDQLDKMPDDKSWAIVKPDYSRYDTTIPAVKSAVTTLLGQDSIMNDAYINRYKGYITGKDPFSMAGVDLGLPIISTKLLNVLLYGEWAVDVDDKDASDPLHSPQMSGWGIAAPGVGVGIGPLKLNVEYRFFKDEFQGEYFDQTYELDRMKQLDSATFVAKEAVLAQFDSSTMSGVFGRANLNLFNLVQVCASYQWMTIKYDKTVPAGTPTSDQTFSAEAGIGQSVKNILNKVKIADISAYYLKKNIGSSKVDSNVVTGEVSFDKFLEPSPFVLMGYKLGFQLAPSMVLYWDTQYTYALDPTATNIYHLKLQKRLNIETVMKF